MNALLLKQMPSYSLGSIKVDVRLHCHVNFSALQMMRNVGNVTSHLLLYYPERNENISGEHSYYNCIL